MAQDLGAEMMNRVLAALESHPHPKLRALVPVLRAKRAAYEPVLLNQLNAAVEAALERKGRDAVLRDLVQPAYRQYKTVA